MEGFTLRSKMYRHNLSKKWDDVDICTLNKNIHIFGNPKNVDLLTTKGILR